MEVIYPDDLDVVVVVRFGFPCSTGRRYKIVIREIIEIYTNNERTYL